MENKEEETIENLKEELEEVREQLEQAAKFGQKLLEENKKNKKELLKEKESNEDKELQIGKYKLQLAEMSEILETIKKEYENENHNNENQENVKEELETVKSRNQLLSHQLTEAEINNKTLLQELNMIKQESNNHDRLSDKLLLEIEELRKKMHQQNDMMNILKNKNEEMHRLNVELAKKIEHEKEENSILNSKLEDTLLEMQGLLKGGNTPEKREELLKKELFQLVLDHESLNERYEEVKENKEKFEKLVSYLAQENEKLTQKVNDLETENPPSIPEQKNLFQEHFEHHPKSGNGFSLFDQISENNDKSNDTNSINENNTNNENNNVKTTPVSPTKEITAPVKSTPMKPVPNSPGDEEFFSIACTAIKIKLAIKFPHKSDEVFKIKAASLYEEAIKKGVPFHEWYTWIDETLNSKLMQINTPIIEHRNDVLIVTPNKKNNKIEAVKKKWFFQK